MLPHESQSLIVVILSQFFDESGYVVLEEIFDLRDKVVIVTGASSGIGVRFATLLDALGAKVVVAARREERIIDLAKSFKDSLAVRCDVTIEDDLNGLVEKTVERYGKIDICINNAGIADPMPALEESPDHFRMVVETNLTSVFTLSRLVAREAISKDHSASIVNVASVLGTIASNSIPQASYAASKAGVVNLTRELALQWAKNKIRVNAIAPGWFPSEMTTVMFESEKAQNWMARITPMGRGGRIEELDGVMLLLASDAGSYLTGQTIVVDGGWTIY